MNIYFKISAILLFLILPVSFSAKINAQEKYNGIYKVSETGRLFTLHNDTAKLYVEKTPLIGIDEFESVKKKYDKDLGQYILLIHLSKKGGEQFTKISEANIGKPLAIIIDDKLLTAPVVQTKITGGELSVTGMEKGLVKEIEKYFKTRMKFRK